jgi:CTP-dependent riboflavin kinase
MTDPAIMEGLREHAGFAVVPGTLNVRLPRALERGSTWRYLPAAEIASDWQSRTGQSGYFLAAVVVAQRYRGLAFQAVESDGAGYPPDQIELFSETHLRSTLGLVDGDSISVLLRGA